MAGGAGHIRPGGSMVTRRFGGVLPVGGREEIIHRLDLAHPPIGQDGGRRVAGNAVFRVCPIDNIVRRLPAARIAQFFRHVILGSAVLAGCPGVIYLVIGARDEQIAVALPAYFTAVIQGDVLRLL